MQRHKCHKTLRLAVVCQWLNSWKNHWAYQMGRWTVVSITHSCCIRHIIFIPKMHQIVGINASLCVLCSSSAEILFEAMQPWFSRKMFMRMLSLHCSKLISCNLEVAGNTATDSVNSKIDMACIQRSKINELFDHASGHLFSKKTTQYWLTTPTFSIRIELTSKCYVSRSQLLKNSPSDFERRSLAVTSFALLELIVIIVITVTLLRKACMLCSKAISDFLNLLII